MSASTHLIPELDRKGLRKFGILTGGIVAAVFGVILPPLLDLETPRWPWVVAGVLWVWALAAPQSLNLVYHFWMRFGLLLNRITTPVILGIVFFLVIFPMALVMKLAGRDPMSRRFDEQAESYRITSRSPQRQNMQRPF